MRFSEDFLVYKLAPRSSYDFYEYFDLQLYEWKRQKFPENRDEAFCFDQTVKHAFYLGFVPENHIW